MHLVPHLCGDFTELVLLVLGRTRRLGLLGVSLRVRKHVIHEGVANRFLGIGDRRPIAVDIHFEEVDVV